MNGIKYIREKSNITQYWLAERIGVTRQTVTQSEKDRWLFDPEYMNELVELMTKHWNKKKKTEMEACENFLRGLREAKKQTDSDTEREGRKKK